MQGDAVGLVEEEGDIESKGGRDDRQRPCCDEAEGRLECRHDVAGEVKEGLGFGSYCSTDVTKQTS